MTFQPFNESDRLSTSQSPLRYDAIISKTIKTDPIGGGFGPQRQDGYGVSYFMDEYKGKCLKGSKLQPQDDVLMKRVNS